MSGQRRSRLTGDQVQALKFAAHRQITRWSNNRDLSPHQHAQRSALTSALRVLQDKAFAHGCELHVPSEADDV